MSMQPDQPGTADAVSPASAGEVRVALENAMVALFKQYYGKGPAAAKAVLREEYAFVVLEDGLTRNEETLLAEGREEEVRRFRLAFEQAVADKAKQAVAEAIGRRVIAYHSQIIFHPVRVFEIFVLESEKPNGA
jgi:uncharacterized protein YbcI